MYIVTTAKKVMFWGIFVCLCVITPKLVNTSPIFNEYLGQITIWGYCVALVEVGVLGVLPGFAM